MNKYRIEYCKENGIKVKEFNKYNVNNYTDFLEKKLEAINYTRCCEELKGKEAIPFEDWLKDKFIKISDTDYTNKDLDCIWGYYELEDIYKLMN